MIAGSILTIASSIKNFVFSPDCRKIEATQIVNQAEQFLKQNLQAWQSLLVEALFHSRPLMEGRPAMMECGLTPSHGQAFS